MKAVLFEKYGRPEEVAHLADVDIPAPREGQVLVKIRAASVNISDSYGVTGTSRLFGGGMRSPKDHRLGGDLSGCVEAAGSGVTRLKPGDEVFGTCSGSFAEYAVAREIRLATKPPNVSFEEAAAVPVAGLTALQCLRDKGGIRGGEEVLINGASGGVGTFAVQIAKALGARVTGVCSTRNVEQARSIGADSVIDYTRENFTKTGQTYDLICNIAGNHSVGAYKRALKPHGKCLVVGLAGNPLLGLMKYTVLGKLGSLTGGKRVDFMGIAKINAVDLGVMAGFMAQGKVRPVIEKLYGLSEAPQVLQYALTKHARAKNVIVVSQE
jgi:NADPH:quinone reductase-like Zn-dependent oxidoreductase